jgi:hypothetical protein
MRYITSTTTVHEPREVAAVQKLPALLLPSLFARVWDITMPVLWNANRTAIVAAIRWQPISGVDW